MSLPGPSAAAECQPKSCACKQRPWTALLLLLAGLAKWSSLAAEETAPSEYELKAVFLYNFAKFIEWPAEAFSTPDAPFTIGVIGQSPFDGHLLRMVENKNINGHPFQVKEFRALNDAKTCHMIFICASERRRVADILKAVGTGSVLTVGESERFVQAGGMIQLVMENNKVRFDINDEAARRAHLRISSKLLNVARRIEPKKTE